jgi:hypothetical protein
MRVHRPLAAQLISLGHRRSVAELLHVGSEALAAAAAVSQQMLQHRP